VCLWHESSAHYFSCTVGPVQIQEKAHRETLQQTCIFVPGGICGSRSALLWIRGTKCQRTIFLARVGPLWIPQNCIGIPYVELVFLRPVVSMGHVVHSDASGTRNVDSVFFLLRRDWCGFYKKRIGTSYVKLVFLHGTLKHYFSCSCGTGTDSTKKRQDTLR
jgi:hypothetical protein